MRQLTEREQLQNEYDILEDQASSSSGDEAAKGPKLSQIMAFQDRCYGLALHIRIWSRECGQPYFTHGLSGDIEAWVNAGCPNSQEISEDPAFQEWLARHGENMHYLQTCELSNTYITHADPVAFAAFIYRLSPRFHCRVKTPVV